MTPTAPIQSVADGASDMGLAQFIVRSMLGRIATATLVRVESVTNTGGVSAVGFVDVQPMVHLLDGSNKPTPHGIVHNMPYLRVQGGVNAVIIDPAVGDIGLAVMASRDISSVKNNKAPSNPGSRRQFSLSDGLYIGGFLNGTPVNYIRFDSDGNITIKPAAKVTVLGDLEATGTITGDADIVAGTVSLKNHVHSDPQGGTSGPATG